MATMVRKQLYIKQGQEMALKRLAQEAGVSEAEIICNALDRHVKAALHPMRDPSIWTQERDFVEELIRQAPAPALRHWSREELHGR